MDSSQIQWSPSLKRTRPREQVLQVLLAADMPLTAMDIFQRLEQAGTPLWPSTVYRVLESFETHGMLHRAALLDNGVAVYEICGHSHRHYAVCVACHCMIALQGCPLERVHLPLQDEGFQVLGHRLQMYGLCGSCAAAGAVGEHEA